MKRDGRISATHCAECVANVFPPCLWNAFASVSEGLPPPTPPEAITFLLDMLSRKLRHCLWISRPGRCMLFRKSTKSFDTWSESKLAWRLVDGLLVFTSGES